MIAIRTAIVIVIIRRNKIADVNYIVIETN